MDHPNIVKIHEYYIYIHDIFIVMEYLNGGELFYKITQNRNDLTEMFIQKVMRELISALSYMHSINIGNQFCLIQFSNPSSLRSQAGEPAAPVKDSEPREDNRSRAESDRGQAHSA